MKQSDTDTATLRLHGVTITHPDRIVFKASRISKGAVAQYYAAIAPFLLKEIKDRPISLLRCPSGIDADCFYQRNLGVGFGTNVYPFAWKYKGRNYKYIYVSDEKGLMEIIQMGVIEIHPWGATIDHIHTPDRMIFDLDPDPTVPFSKVKEAACEVRDRLTQAGLHSTVKCTGGKGLHVVVSLTPINSWGDVKEWARALAHTMVREAPDTYVATITKSKRREKILIDFFRNDYTATGIAGYSLRAHPGAPVALPLKWRELTTLRSADQFHMDAVLARMTRRTPRDAPPEQQLPKDKW